MNKALKKVSAFLFELYIKGSLHVSLAVTAFSYITVIQYDLEVTVMLYGFIFAATLFAYNLIKYSSLVGNGPPGFSLMFKAIAILSFLAFAAAVISIWYLGLKVFLFMLIPGLLTAAYALPIFQNGKNLRQVYGSKLLIIAAVWSLITVGVPFVAQDDLNISGWLLFSEGVQRMLFVMVLTLPFDIRDITADDVQMGTIPQIFGVKKTKWIGTVMLFTVFLIEVFQTQVNSLSFFVFLLMIILTGSLIWRSMVIQPRFFSSFWVEGIPVAWAMLLWLHV